MFNTIKIEKAMVDQAKNIKDLNKNLEAINKNLETINNTIKEVLSLESIKDIVRAIIRDSYMSTLPM